jgi:hypothetical protein
MLMRRVSMIRSRALIGGDVPECFIRCSSEAWVP